MVPDFLCLVSGDFCIILHYVWYQIISAAANEH